MTTAAAPTRPRLDPLLDAPLIGPRVLCLVGDESGCSVWRVWQPVSHLRLMGYPCDWVATRDPRQAEVTEGYHAVVLCRVSWGSAHRGAGERRLREWRRRGLRVFFEADDDFFTPFVVPQQLARINPEKTRAEVEAAREAALWLLQRVDGVTVTTQYLASTVRRFTEAPVEVVANAIDHEWFSRMQRGVPRPIPGPTIGWAGGNRPDADLAVMAQAWGRIARRFPDVTFVVVGHQPPVIKEHVPEERLHRIPWMDPGEYPRGLVGIDIGCCPLDERPFNRAKSPIKAFEYALSGAAVVASPTVYRHILRDNENGWLAENAEDWEAVLAYLLVRPDERKASAKNLKRDVLGRWSLRTNAWRWPAAWHRLMGPT